jgi:erythromycin esterase-like protein
VTEESSAGDVTDWLAGNALPLHGLVAGGPTMDLQPLTDVLQDVRVVGLGEATFGTREFFQLKHSLLEFLVTELGFSVFAMDSRPRSQVITSSTCARPPTHGRRSGRGHGTATHPGRSVRSCHA